MSCGKWYTLEDVTQDLSRASGQLVNGLNESHMVVGCQRPRYNYLEDKFDEMDMYRKCNSNNAVTKPDLHGITHLIRMVDAYSTGESSLEETENLKRMKESFNTETVVISKLNPEVPAFEPKNGINTENNNVNICGKKSNNTQPLKDTKNVGADIKQKKPYEMNTQKCDENNLKIPDTTKINISSLDSMEKRKLQERLRSDISNTSKTNCIKVKRQRNLAIATLMKLLSSPLPKSEEQEKPKLITPQYFESNVCDKEKTNETDKNISSISTDDITGTVEPTSLVDNSINKVNLWFERRYLSPIVDDQKLPESQNTSNISIQDSTDIDANDVSPTSVKKSIEKVSKWINEPKEQNIKSPVLFVGPVTFKRKLIRHSPVTQTSSSGETRTSDNIQNYVPSAYASELSERYMKRLKDREVSKNIWTKLEEDLKLKDEIIRNKSLSSLDS